MTRPGRLLLIFLLGMLINASAHADLLHLKDGRVFEGEVTVQGDVVRVRMGSGVTMRFRRSQVARIEKQKSATGEYGDRIKRLADDDAKGWLELGRWCLKKDLEVEAERAFEKVLTMASAELPAAKFELAKLLEQQGRVRQAIRHYDELAVHAGHRAARARSLGLKRDLDQTRARHFQAGCDLLAAGKPQSALEQLEQAYQASYPLIGPSAATAIPQQTILREMARARAAVEEALVIDQPQTLTTCSKCNGSGWTTCPRCHGRRRIRTVQKYLTSKGMRTRRVTIDCPNCRRKGETWCGGCGGSHVNLSRVQGTLRGNLQSLASDAQSHARGRMERAVHLVHRKVVGGRMAVAQSDQPPFRLCSELREALDRIPLPTNRGWPRRKPALLQAWAGSSQQARAAFLVDYGRKFAAFMAPWFPLSKLTIEPVDPQTDPRKEARPVDPITLAALPESHHGDWVACTGRLQQGGKIEIPGAKAWALDVGAPHNVVFHTWAPEAKALHADVLDHLRISELQNLAQVYPYEKITGKLETLVGRRVTLYGRVIHRPRQRPMTRVVVFAADAAADERLSRLASRVRRPVTFRFQGTPLAEASKLFELLAGFPIKLDVPHADAIQLTLHVQNEPLGLALEKMLRHANLRWAFTDKGIRIAASVSAAERQDVQAVLGMLRSGE